MEQELIKDNASTLESAARDSLHEANVHEYKFSNLLIQIGFAIGGLAAARIVNNGKVDVLIYSKWGLIFLAISIIFGGIQSMIYRSFFRKQGRLLIKATDRWKYYGSNPSDHEAANDARKIMEELETLSESSSVTFLYLQITFVLLGVVFALVDVFKL